MSAFTRWSVDTLSVSSGLLTDEFSREWGVRAGSDKGWIEPPATRPNRIDRPAGHGAFRSPAFRDYRQFTLGGFVACPTADIRERTELELSALCSDPGRLYEFRRQGLAFDQFALVELDDAPKIEMVTAYRLDWQFTFAAPDPRKHDYQVQAPVGQMPVTSPGGLDFTSPGLSFASPGLDFGPAPLVQPVTVGNYGTAPASPLIQIIGPATTPLVRSGSGAEFVYAAEIATGETVTINCDTFTRDGFPARRVISNVHGDVRNYLSLSAWPVIEPGAQESFSLVASTSGSTQLRVIFRSAWW